MAALCFKPVYASDHEVLVTENNQGGYIILTAVDCPIEEMTGSKVSATTFGDNAVYGCWFLHNGKVYIAWVTNQGIHRAEYDPSIFRVEKVL